MNTNLHQVVILKKSGHPKIKEKNVAEKMTNSICHENVREPQHTPGMPNTQMQKKSTKTVG